MDERMTAYLQIAFVVAIALARIIRRASESGSSQGGGRLRLKAPAAEGGEGQTAPLPPTVARPLGLGGAG